MPTENKDSDKWRKAALRMGVGLLLTAVLVVVVHRMETRAKTSSHFVILNENVSFDELSDDRSLPFTIKQPGIITVQLHSTMKAGLLGVELTDPGQRTVFAKSGKELAEEQSISAAPGEWSIRVYCQDGAEGQYSIEAGYKKNGD